MARTTIDFGIDLGTTNSAIAFAEGTRVEVVQNRDGSLLTPSAIYISEKGKLRVGRHAKEKAFDDDENTSVEFKLRMGLDPSESTKSFTASKQKMTPEQLSAEVLKSLREDVRTSTGLEINAAVITIPAAFESPQSDATRRAAELAGFRTCHLLNEPVAAALAYGFQSKSDRVFWLVYDFGGGTFDAAIMSVRDGMIQVVNHAGDNFLGGKNIDWDIVERLLIPAVQEEFGLKGITRSDKRWAALTSQLKASAEEAKIQVSRSRKPCEISIEGLYTNPTDITDRSEFTFTLTPEHLQKLLRPWVNQSISLSKRALEEKRLKGSDLEKVIMVGGSSLFPWVQEWVAQELGAPVDISIDPMTVVARGAAIFASTRPLESTTTAERVPGQFHIEWLTYDPVGPDPDPLVGGRVVHPSGGSLAGYSVILTEIKTRWESGKITMGEKGLFQTDLHAESGRKCEYEIALYDQKGSKIPCLPESISYTMGLAIAGEPMSHHIGVATAKNTVKIILEKGTVLPAKSKDIVVYTTQTVKRGEESTIIRIPIVEGENDTRADRNRFVGAYELLGNHPKITRDIPAGTEIKVRIEIDEAKRIQSSIFIELLDEEFEGSWDLKKSSAKPEALKGDLKSEKNRLDDLKKQAAGANDARAKDVIQDIEDQDLVQQAQTTVASAQGDADARGEADRKILNLRTKVDQLEDMLAWPKLVQEAEAQLATTREMVEDKGSRSQRTLLQELQGRLLDAITQKNSRTLRAIVQQLDDLHTNVLLEQPEFWAGWLGWLKGKQATMSEPELAVKLFKQGDRAIQEKDLESLQGACRQLQRLLPPEQQASAAAAGFGSTIE